MTAPNLPLIRRGSSTDIYRCDKDSIAFDCTNFFSVFDVGRSKFEIPGKGRAVCAAAMSTDRIAEKLGIPTCVIEQITDTAIRVRESQIPAAPTVDDENYVMPLEWIYRVVVAGSIERDFRSGKKKPENYGLPAGIIPPFSTPFPYLVHMITTKREDIDREVGVEEACHIGGITLADLAQFWSMIDRLTGGISLALSPFGMNLLDGKFEVIIGWGRRKCFGDLCGEPDGSRIIEVVNGTVQHLGKEFLRQLYIEMGYYVALMQARAKGEPDIPMPELPPDQIEEASRRYARVGDTYGRLM